VELALTFLLGIISGIIVGIVLMYLQKERIDSVIESIQLRCFSIRMAKKAAHFYYSQFPGHIGNFGSNLRRMARSGRIPYLQLAILPKTMEYIIELYRPDHHGKVTTWGTVGHTLYDQARYHYRNSLAKQRKILQLALEAFGKELEIEHDPRAVNRQAQVLILLGQPSAAEEVLYKNIQRVKSEPGFYSSLRDPDLQESYRISLYILSSLILGEFPHVANKRDEAISLLSLYIDWSSPDFYQTHVALSKRASLRLMNDQFEEAEKDLSIIDPDKLEPKVNVGFLRNNQFRLWAGRVNRAITKGDKGLINEYWNRTESAFQEARETHRKLQEEGKQVYYDPLIETDLRGKYETEFRNVVQEYYRLKSILEK
jgi:hypothetical protein